MIQDPATTPEAIVANFDQHDPDLTFTKQDVVYTIGSNWKQLYLTRTVEGKLQILPAQWTVATSEWVPYHPTEGGQSPDWLSSCGSCHVTGLDTKTWGATEFGIGCESCHGPSAAHAANPEAVKPFAQVDNQVCGSCHSRGASPEGYPFPATYRPGDKLTDHFTFTTTAQALWPDGSARLNHQQYMDWQLGSDMATSGKVACTTCHAVHDKGAANGQLVAPLNALCLECHNEQEALVRHTPFHEKAMAKHKFTCADCHMPKMATSAVALDLRNHSFLQPNPQASIDHGGLDIMPNACNRCHSSIAESPQWAAQTIAYAMAQTTPSASAFFGPGPTPTSPPPPTPVPSVGQPVKRAQVETSGWLHNSILLLVAVVALGIVGLIAYSIRSRRANNA